MISTHDFKKGARLELDGFPWAIVSTNTQTPSARGAATLVKVRLKNILTGQVSDRTFKSGEKFQEPDLDMRPSQYLYSAPDGPDTIYYFMDTANYEQFELRNEHLGDMRRWLTENLEVTAVSYNGVVVGVELPQFIVLEVDRVEPGSRGDTASGAVTTTAHTTTGIRVQVPLFVKSGDQIRIDTTTGTFKDRQNA